MANENFLSRWSRRKLAAGSARPAEAAAAPAETAASAPESSAPVAAASAPAAAGTASSAGTAPSPPSAAPGSPAADGPPPLSLDDVARLTPDSDFRPFVARGVDETIKRSALKKLFTDPHFNIMDGLDTYIEDYNKFEPIPAAMLASLNHAKALLNPLSHLERPQSRLLEEDPAKPEEALPAADDREDAGAPAAGSPAAGSHEDVPDAGDPIGTTQENPEDDNDPIQSL